MNFLLDQNTIFLSLAIGHLFTAALIGAYWRRHKKDRVIGIFLTAKLLQAFAWLYLIARGGISDLPSISFANSLLFVGDSLEVVAVLGLLDALTRRVKRWYVGLTALDIAGFHLILFVHNEEFVRIAFASAGTAVLLVYPAYRMLCGSASTTVQKVMGYFYLLTVAAFLGRAASALLSEETLSFFTPGFAQTIAFLALYLIMISGNTGFVLLLKERSDRELLRLAQVDDLTGALNRRTFITLADKQLSACVRKNKPVSLLLFDVDYFKTINDTYGHAAGDRVLADLSHRIRGVLGPDGLFSRYGGDEFAVLLPGKHEAESLDTAERMRQTAATIPLLGGNANLTISLGALTVIPDGNTQLETLYSECDEALYRAKKSGRNRVVQS